MKIYEYNYKNNNLPAKLKTINANYDHGSSDNLPIQKFLYNNILDFDKTLIYTLNNGEGNIVSHAYLFRVLLDKARQLGLPDKTYIIREVETLPAFRRKGYCKKLMNWIYNKHKNKFIYLEVNKTNIYALKCYSFLKKYNNSLLENYYKKYYEETNNYYNKLDILTKNYMIKNNPHMLSELILYGN